MTNTYICTVFLSLVVMPFDFFGLHRLAKFSKAGVLIFVSRRLQSLLIVSTTQFVELTAGVF